jgi:hypothetical protein
MSTRAELRTLIRLAPEVKTTAISDANINTLLDKGTIDLALKGRALPRNEKVNVVASQMEYVLSGASPVLTGNDFLAIDMMDGGVLFSDGSRWIGAANEEFKPVTREWLDLNYQGWRTNSAASVPLYWYVSTAEDNSSNLVVGLVDKPSTARTDGLWIHYLARGTLMTGDTHYPWTGSTTQLVHLEPYDPLLVYYVLEWVNRLITKNSQDADAYKLLYESGAALMAKRMPLTDHLIKDGFTPPPYFSRAGMVGGMRY